VSLQKLCTAEEFITNYLITWFSYRKEIDQTTSNPHHPEYFKVQELGRSLFIKLSNMYWELACINVVELNWLYKMKVHFS
jgi:hypothetical protein